MQRGAKGCEEWVRGMCLGCEGVQEAASGVQGAASGVRGGARGGVRGGCGGCGGASGRALGRGLVDSFEEAIDAIAGEGRDAYGGECLVKLLEHQGHRLRESTHV